MNAITDIGAFFEIEGIHVCRGSAPAFAKDVAISKKNTTFCITPVVASILIASILSVLYFTQINATQNRKAASVSPRITYVFLADSAVSFPLPRFINKKNIAVTISQKIRRKKRLADKKIPLTPARVQRK